MEEAANQYLMGHLHKIANVEIKRGETIQRR